VRDARHLDLDRDGDVAFHLLGRLAAGLGDHLHQGRDRIGIGLDIEGHESEYAGGENRRQKHHHQGAMTQGELNNAIHDAQSPWAARSMNSEPLVTTRSPG
jgi:hypothetical protein